MVFFGRCSCAAKSHEFPFGETLDTQSSFLYPFVSIQDTPLWCEAHKEIFPPSFSSVPSSRYGVSFVHTMLWRTKKDVFTFLPFSLFAAKPARAIKMKIGGAEKEIIVGFSSSFPKAKKRLLGATAAGLLCFMGSCCGRGKKLETGETMSSV